MSAPTPAREAKLFRNNRSQAVRIPADWEMPGDRVTIRRDGDRLVLEPVRRRGLLGLLASWDRLDEDLPLPDDPPPASEDVL
ncbi:AbrB/MazE/SpoVT family DNA-binding domain-containing protein [Jannaschia sp. Os4]|uniref:antitoxin n=1 Tax=Jannaschia sp. Os4 TaxID=2807617 RepID=UPI001939FD41|nr:AbrB/MazE/SpoVT family DNA-binding domain-containing protein [Jannaschia sp. Os4]MBM2578083.1 AbrB/MazE/SpoVT family DNA-binding domain-containing protein [Jannaschia sp. Os4]MBM2578113.1 AbrB/MazE/SpoVT family DNA-binding domain-containing protein [Jannaschia sp. Os4]